ncbi:epoxide hydrolase 3-like isoform X1 [Carex rostrata]
MVDFVRNLLSSLCRKQTPPPAPPAPPAPAPMPSPHMDSFDITHRTVHLNGIDIHVAEKGTGPVVVLLHGFPEIWYTWRHQINGLAALGYRVIAPDLRGYGDSSVPNGAASYSALHVVGDVVALIDSLGQEKVLLVGHDWGAIMAWYVCLFRPDKVKALVNLSVPFAPRNPARKPVEYLRSTYGDDYYICRIQEPEAIEAEFARLGTELVLKKFLTYRNPAPFFIPKDGWGSPDEQIPLPSWLSEEDIKYYVNKFEKTGFTGGLNYYRALDLTWELTAPWTGAQIKVPTKFIVGDLDLTYNAPGIQDFIHKGGMKKFVPMLDEVVVVKGAGHFINEEKPSEITQHIHSFFSKF